MTIAELLANAQVIYDETTAGANTHQRIGQMFIDVINELSKRTMNDLKVNGATEWYGQNPFPGQPFNTNQPANTLRAYPWFIPYDVTLQELAIRVSGSLGANLNIALYTDTGSLYPDDIVAGTSFANVDVSALGEVVLGLAAPVELEAGLYWIVWNVDTTTGLAANNSTQMWQILPRQDTSTTGATVKGFSDAVAFAALPSPFGAGATEASYDPLQLFFQV